MQSHCLEGRRGSRAFHMAFPMTALNPADQGLDVGVAKYVNLMVHLARGEQNTGWVHGHSRPPSQDLARISSII